MPSKSAAPQSHRGPKSAARAKNINSRRIIANDRLNASVAKALHRDRAATQCPRADELPHLHPAGEPHLLALSLRSRRVGEICRFCTYQEWND